MQKKIPILDIYSLCDVKENNILVSGLADYLKQNDKMHFPHRHSFYHIVFFTKGKGSHSIDFSNFKLKTGQIYFMIPGQVHTWEFDEGVDGYVLNFNSSFFESFLLRPDYFEQFSFLDGNAAESVIELPSYAQIKAVSIFENIMEQKNLADSSQLDMMRVLLLQLLILVEQNTNRSNNLKAPGSNYTVLKNYQKLIERNYTRLRLPKQYAELLNITPNHLNALCKDYLGMQAGEVIRNRILLEAKRMLINNNMNISEITYALNFNDNSYFSKFFKKITGITPEEFRKMI